MLLHARPRGARRVCRPRPAPRAFWSRSVRRRRSECRDGRPSRPIRRRPRRSTPRGSPKSRAAATCSGAAIGSISSRSGSACSPAVPPDAEPGGGRGHPRVPAAADAVADARADGHPDAGGLRVDRPPGESHDRAAIRTTCSGRSRRCSRRLALVARMTKDGTLTPAGWRAPGRRRCSRCRSRATARNGAVAGWLRRELLPLMPHGGRPPTSRRSSKTG